LSAGRARAALAGAVVLAVVAGGCELVLNLDQLNNKECPQGQKPCYNKCVSESDPSTGCSLNTCAPCVLPHATAKCTPTGQCVVATCLGDYDDCDPHVDGCETDLAHDPDHCGSCTAPACVTTNGIPGCSARKCATGGCNAGYDDCNHDPRDGCETDLRTDADCGVCNLTCASGTSCVDQVCQ
jgi:hypothetical protein